MNCPEYGHQQRRAAVASAIGSTEAEGLRVSPDTTADLDAYARGELDTEALRARTLTRHTRYGTPGWPTPRTEETCPEG